jgi:lysophospholipase L1-like esterase
MPLDLVVLMLGTNDLKHRFSVTANDIADSIEVLIRAVQRSEAGPAGVPPAVMVIAPPPMQEIDWLGEMFLGGADKSLQLAGLIRDAAKRTGATFLNAADVVESSAVDGIHLDSDAHQRLGAKVKEIAVALVG